MKIYSRISPKLVAKKSTAICISFFLFSICFGQSPMLKSIIYDFDGLDIGANNLPDGDYKNNDLSYKIAPNPITPSDVIGDRVLEMDLTWSTGIGEFGKSLSRFYELNASTDVVNFYFYNPLFNGGKATVEVAITEDDNQNNIYEYLSDDRWVHTITIQKSGAWQLISIPISSFKDENGGGNGIFDAAFTAGAGMLFSIGFTFKKPLASNITEKYYLDMIAISENSLPIGATILDLPTKSINDYCILGALAGDATAATSANCPSVIEGLFPGGKKIKYVNWFLDYAYAGSNAESLPGAEVQTLLNNGYRPIITWEMMYSEYPRLDPIQPRLDKLLVGSFDSYIDAFADVIKSYNDTVILRIFHEFEGNWYPWSLTENNQDPNKYIAAYRYVVDRFRMRGATKVQWMWCLNADPKPYLAYNWVKAAYPGDNYVDIVASDIYNHPDLGIPAWKSFRYTFAESYYYLNKYFSNKPLFICEVASRERYKFESLGSQTKAEWLCQMSKDLQTYFNKTRALIFFSTQKEHDWRLNSSTVTQEAIQTCIWDNNYYFQNSNGVHAIENKISFNLFPNPFTDDITISIDNPQFPKTIYQVNIYDLTGKHISNLTMNEKITFGNNLSSGLYIIEVRNEFDSKRIKIIKTTGE